MVVLRSLYRIAASRTVAVVLLLALAGIALLGSFVSQLSFAGVRWAVAGDRLHPLIRALSLNDLFQARWLILLIVALMVNLVLCSLGRLRSRFLEPGQIRGLLHFRQIATAIPIGESFVLIEEELRLRRFRIRHRAHIGRLVWAARRNGVSLAGSVIFHLSLLIAVAGFLVRSQKGVEGELVLFPDQSGTVSLPTGDTLQVQLLESGTEYNLGPGASSYLLRQRRSSLILYRDNRFQRPATLSINHPVRDGSIGLFQADPAQLFIIRIIPPDITLRVRENEPFELTGGRFFVGTARLGTVYLSDSVFGRMPVQAPLFRLVPGDSSRFREVLADTLRAEQPLALGKQRLSLLNIRQGAHIAYRYDPALPWFYVAGALFLLGMILRGFLPAYEFYGTITEEEGETVIRLGGRALGAFTSLRPLINRVVDRFVTGV
jgi:cytochrome c biogenesis protein ResB